MNYGRKRILSDVVNVTRDNVVKVLDSAYTTHLVNRMDIDTLYDYYKGKQGVLNKRKDTRTDINNIVCVNHANEIVSFKLGYTLGEPIQYIRRGESDVEQLRKLNDYMLDADKPSVDTDIAEWLYICGVGYRFITVTEPFDLYSLDPRSTFIVYSNTLGNKPLMGVTYVESETDRTPTFTIYTENEYFVVTGGKVVAYSRHALGCIPIVEYCHNNARLGAFEIVKDMLDALNMIESNRTDDVEQFVNAYLCILGATIDEDTHANINKYKMLGLPEGADAKYITAHLQQSDSQTLVNDLYDRILTICGLPNRGQGGGSSDNGIAVYLRDGFHAAETQALAFEKMWKKSERQFLRIVLRILKDTQGMSIEVNDIEIKFARRYTDNILTKAQALTILLDDGVEPSSAFATVGIWSDPYSVFEESKEFLKKWSVNEDEFDVRDYGQTSGNVNEID